MGKNNDDMKNKTIKMRKMKNRADACVRVCASVFERKQTGW